VEIGTDEEYAELLRKIVTGAEYLDRGKLSPQMYERAMMRYDELCKLVKAYRGMGSNGNM
jgi:hypothetical protein